jgi:N-acetylgalactosaminide alpha-2,6-sialyltransferase (sialyltransferase 7E)
MQEHPWRVRKTVSPLLSGCWEGWGGCSGLVLGANKEPSFPGAPWATVFCSLSPARLQRHGLAVCLVLTTMCTSLLLVYSSLGSQKERPPQQQQQQQQQQQAATATGSTQLVESSPQPRRTAPAGPRQLEGYLGVADHKVTACAPSFPPAAQPGHSVPLILPPSWGSEPPEQLLVWGSRKVVHQLGQEGLHASCDFLFQEGCKVYQGIGMMWVDPEPHRSWSRIRTPGNSSCRWMFSFWSLVFSSQALRGWGGGCGVGGKQNFAGTSPKVLPAPPEGRRESLHQGSVPQVLLWSLLGTALGWKAPVPGEPSSGRHGGLETHSAPFGLKACFPLPPRKQLRGLANN